MKALVGLLRALADENRLRVLFALHQGELCACQLAALLRLAPSTVSQHMNILRRAGLVAAEKRGRWMYYRMADEEASAPAGKAMALLGAWREDAPAAIRRDRERLGAILRRDPEEICRRQARRAAGRRGAAKGGAGGGKNGETIVAHRTLG